MTKARRCGRASGWFVEQALLGRLHRLGGLGVIVLLDSAGQLVVPDAAAVNVMATATAPRLSIRQEFDQTPGRERFVGLVSRGPLPDLPALLTRVNAEAAADRAARLDALARALGAEVTLVPATEMEHR